MRRNLYQYFIVATCALLASCRSAVLSEPANQPGSGAQEGTGRVDQPPTSQVTVGLRIALERPAGSTNGVRLIAVVTDADGEQNTLELGTYYGRVREREPSGDELIAVYVEGREHRDTVRVVRRQKAIEVLRARTPTGAPREPSARERLIHEILVPAGTPVHADDPAVGRQGELE